MIHLSALAGIVAISFSAIFVRLADVSPTTAGFFRAAYAIPVLVLVHLAGRDRRTRRQRMLAIGAGLLLGVDLALWHIAIEYIGAGLATVVANVQVVWVGVVAWMIYRERPTTTAFAVVPLVLVGIAMIGGFGTEDAFGDRPLLGSILATGASITYSGFLLLFRASNRSLAPTAGPLLDATAGAALALLIMALALVGQVFGWLLIAGALPRLPALETSVMLLIQPAATIVWARILFEEKLSPLQWTGVLIVLAGVAAAGARGAVRRERSPTPAVEAIPPGP